MEASTQHDSHAHGRHVHGGPKVYGAVFLALLALTIITVIASKIDFGSASANVIIALGIATVKGTLVSRVISSSRDCSTKSCLPTNC